MVCKWEGCSAEVTRNKWGRPAKHCQAHKNHPRAPVPTTCTDCGGPINRVQIRTGRARLCLPCRDSRKAERNRENARQFRKDNPAAWRAIVKRAYLKRSARIRTEPQQVPLCRDCGQETNRGPQSLRCRPCLRRHMKLRSYYGIGISDYNKLLVAQDGRCAVCQGEPTGHGDLHVDHDHVTGRIRGLLCSKCNLGLGNLRDSPALLLAAHAYLTR